MRSPDLPASSESLASVVAGPIRRYPTGENVAALFASQAQATPEATAIIGDGGAVSYADLARRVDHFTAALRQQDVAPEQPIGILMHRTSDLVAMLLSVLKAGGAYVPLDPADPPDRNRVVLEQSGCRLVIGEADTIAAWRARHPTADAEGTHFLDVAQMEATEVGTEAQESAPGDGRLAYILFTSGSSGVPKGVEIEHRMLVNLLFAARDLLSFTSADRFLAVSTIGFDISVAELFLPLITGGSVLLRSRDALLAPRALADDIRRHGVTVFQTGPSVWSVLLAEVPDFPILRVAITTAEPVSPALARRIATCGEQAWNLYGPTEATVWATAHPLLCTDTTGDADSSVSAPIGRPLPNTTVLLLDEQGQATTPGARGELYLGGAGVARGYRGNSELTREKFIEIGPERSRFYRTGDVVTCDNAGTVQYFGRNDDQLKIRGVRIEPREVEAAILSHPDVEFAAATWFPVANYRSIAAGIVTKDASTLSASTLHAWLVPRLPAPVIPSRFVFLPLLPLAPSGKVDRAAIRDAALNQQGTADATSPEALSPLTETEAQIAAIWCDVLELTSIAADDHFFAIGGDSLAAIRMVLAVESRFGVTLPPQAAFDSPVLGRFAAWVDRVRAKGPDGGRGRFIYPLVEVPGTRPFFFSGADFKLAVRHAWKVPCSLYAISDWALGQGFVDAESLAELARSHIAEMRAIEPKGPYRVAGYSFGGLVAWEMSQQLQEAGEELEVLLLLDPMQPFQYQRTMPGQAASETVIAIDESRGSWIVKHLRRVWTDPGTISSYLRRAIFRTPPGQWLLYKMLHLHGRRPNPISEMLLPRDRWPAFWYSAQRMTRGYVARPFVGPTMAVFPDHGLRYATWKHLLDAEAEVLIAPVHHLALFEESNIPQWMEPLRQFVERSAEAENTDAVVGPSCEP